MRKDSPLIIVRDGDTIVDMIIHCPTTSHPQPDTFEMEIVRIFNEHKELQTETKRLKEELERLKPKPLLFDTIDGFKVIINDSVPEGEIWFATDKQLQMALEFSAKQIEKAKRGE